MKYSLTLCAALVSVAFPAFAHVTANPNVGPADSYFQTSFRVSHGCDGSDTTSIKIDIPAGIVSLKPQAKPGWTVEIAKHKLEKPVPAGHGKMADEEFTSVTWKSGNLPDSQYDDFGIVVKLPNTPHEILWFPVTQSCVKGENLWTQIPKKGEEWHDLKNPAPFVHIMDADSDMPGMNH